MSDKANTENAEKKDRGLLYFMLIFLGISIVLMVLFRYLSSLI